MPPTSEHASIVATWAPVASAAIAAIAATASWRSVYQARGIWQAGLLPDLHAVVVVRDERWALVVENAGGGLARLAAYAMISGDQFDDGLIGETGFVRPGEGTTVVSRLPVSSPLETDALFVAIYCEDARGRQHVWSLAGSPAIGGAGSILTPRPSTRWPLRHRVASGRALLRNLYDDPAKREQVDRALPTDAREG